MNLAMTEVMQQFFDNTTSENLLEPKKKSAPGQKSMLDSEKINLNEEEIRNLYVSLLKVCFEYMFFLK